MSAMSPSCWTRDDRRSRRCARMTLPVQTLLFRDDPVFNFVIDCLRQNLLLHEFVLGFIRPALDDLRRVGVADAGDRLQLIGRSGIDVDQIGFLLTRSLLRRGCALLCRSLSLSGSRSM